MITRVQVQNYKSIADVNVELGPLTVLVGRNGAGKSTFIDAVRLIHDALRFNLETAIDQRGGMPSICRWTSTGRSFNIHILLEASWGGNRGQYEVSLSRAPANGYKVKRESAVVSYPEFVAFPDEDDAEFPEVDEDDADLVLTADESMEIVDGRWRLPESVALESDQLDLVSDPQTLQLSLQTGFHRGMIDLRRYLRQTAFYSIFPNTLRRPQEPSSEGALNEHGGNLGSALKQILSQGTWKGELIAAIRRLVGDIIDIRVKSAGGYLITELKHESDGGKDKWFNLSQESDGTLRMLGLLVAIYQDPSPSVIFIEEPELTIHPGALAVLADILREASQRTQVVITTQSPDLISHFSADELRVVERVNGATEIGMVDDAQRKAIESHLFTGGELLRMEGLHRQLVGGVGA